MQGSLGNGVPGPGAQGREGREGDGWKPIRAPWKGRREVYGSSGAFQAGPVGGLLGGVRHRPENKDTRLPFPRRTLTLASVPPLTPNLGFGGMAGVAPARLCLGGSEALGAPPGEVLAVGRLRSSPEHSVSAPRGAGTRPTSLCPPLAGPGRAVAARESARAGPGRPTDRGGRKGRWLGRRRARGGQGSGPPNVHVLALEPGTAQETLRI